ncbi:MAG: nitronate monooxygenase [Cellvibrionaceae bacterium]|nr:nitronate monooxygenase [Cellvibrionaceae bacterium]
MPNATDHARVRTPLTEMLEIEHPIIQGGMQYVGYAEMAAAVALAGGVGILTGLTQETPEALRNEIEKCKALIAEGMKSKPEGFRIGKFGVNLTILPMLIPADYEGFARVCGEEARTDENPYGVSLVEMAGGNPKPWIKIIKETVAQRDTSSQWPKILHKSATLRHAMKAKAAGVDLVEIVGYEASIAGGQPGDEVGLWVQLPLVAKTLHPTPVVAAGATAHGSQLGAALTLGAVGVTMATRFLVTKECPIKDSIKQRLNDPKTDERSTCVVLSKLNNSTRVFRNQVSEEILDIESKSEQGKDLSFEELAPLASGKRAKAMWQENGDTEDAMFSCSQSVGIIGTSFKEGDGDDNFSDEIPTCEELLTKMVDDCAASLKNANQYSIS